MKMQVTKNYHEQILKDTLYFWGFWIVLILMVVGIIEASITGPLKVIAALIVPQILPVCFVALLFDFLFMRKKIVLFFLFSIPLCFLFGKLINIWFNWIMSETRITVNTEVLLLIFSAMFIGFRYIRVAIFQKMLLKEEENKRVIAELQYLRSQLNPHFLFNALNSIYSLILSQSDKAGEATLALSELMRFHIDLAGKQFINLADEIIIIERYIALEELKLDGRCEIKINISGDPKKIKIAPLILLPFIENAFKHGISSEPNTNFVYMNLLIEANSIEFEIVNSIPATSARKKGQDTKLGIDNTLKRLELHYKDNYQFHSEIKEKAFNVYLMINL